MASHPPHNQAEALNFVKKQEKELAKKLFEKESEIVEFLNWIELPIGIKVRNKFKEVHGKFLEYFEAQKWKDEGEARGLGYSMRFLRILEKMVESSKKDFQKIQTRKQKEG